MVYIKDIKPGVILANGIVKVLILGIAEPHYSILLDTEVLSPASYDFYYGRVSNYIFIINEDKATIMGSWEVLC